MIISGIHNFIEKNALWPWRKRKTGQQKKWAHGKFVELQLRFEK
jgi:hypothetical protein